MRMNFQHALQEASRLLWGSGTLALLLGTGLFLTIRMHALPWRNLGYALRCALDRRSRTGGEGISPFSSLMTTLAATIGTGNIVGVATALAAGGPGALVWMELSAVVGLATKWAECALAVRFRRREAAGGWYGGPMYVMRDGIRPRFLGALLAALFSLFTLFASFGIGCMAQSNSMAAALSASFSVPPLLTGVATALLALVISLRGIRGIAGASRVLVPLMALGYCGACAAVIWGNRDRLGEALSAIFTAAFFPGALPGAVAGSLTATWLESVRLGVSRGVFSNEAGMGAAAISAACAETDSPARQGYISMTGVFFDTILLCTLTALALCVSGVTPSPARSGAAWTLAAFSTVLGPAAGTVIGICLTLFAFSTILGWAYQGEQAARYLLGRQVQRPFRLLFCLAAGAGAVLPLEGVFAFSDLCNAMMCLPNLVCLLLLSGTASREILSCQRQIRRDRD